MLEFAKNYLKNYAFLKLFGDEAVRYPMLISYYVTHKCNLHCTYCSDGNGVPFYENLKKELNLEEIEELFARIIPATKVLDITGGEPLLRPDILEVIRVARDAGFKKIFFNTNGLLLDRMPGLIDLIDVLYISLDSLDVDTLSQIYRTEKLNIDRILSNVDYLSKAGKSSKVVVSAVLMQQNLRHIRSLMEYCEKRGFGFIVSPALKGKTADVSLQFSNEYQHCIDEIVEYKNRGFNVVGTEGYFNIIRNFSKYKCYPLLMPVINPEGRVYLPCLEIAEQLENLLEYHNLNDLIHYFLKGERTSNICGNVCHIFCHAGLSEMFDKPVSLIREYYSMMKLQKPTDTMSIVPSN
jgi:MoaA/NifB/PqqE/SkfB family radical SAM enzyme